MRLLVSLLLVGYACILAGCYGALHNQISYSVAPSYFHDFKFSQFGIDGSLHNRLGASLVGILASWWVGLILAPLLCLAGWRISTHSQFISAFSKNALIIMGLTLVLGLLALGLAKIWVDAPMADRLFSSIMPNQSLEFYHAAIMHDASYFAAFMAVIYGIYQMRRLGK